MVASASNLPSRSVDNCSPTLLSSANGVKSVFPLMWRAELALKEPLCLDGPNVGIRWCWELIFDGFWLGFFCFGIGVMDDATAKRWVLAYGVNGGGFLRRSFLYFGRF